MQEIANSPIGTKPSVWLRIKGHALKITTIGMGAAFLVSRVSADIVNTTQVDEMFDVVNNHIIPQAAGTIGAMPALIIPLAFLLVILAIVFFIPDLLYEFLDVIKSAIRGKKG